MVVNDVLVCPVCGSIMRPDLVETVDCAGDDPDDIWQAIEIEFYCDSCDFIEVRTEC